MPSTSEAATFSRSDGSHAGREGRSHRRARESAATIEAMKESRRGNLRKFANVEELFDDLDADD